MSRGVGIALAFLALLFGGAGGYLLRDVQLGPLQERVKNLERASASQAADYERKLADCEKRVTDLKAERDNLAELLQETRPQK